MLGCMADQTCMGRSMPSRPAGEPPAVLPERQPCTKSSRKVRKNRRVFIDQPGMEGRGDHL